jgi:hypothetical protein
VGATSSGEKAPAASSGKLLVLAFTGRVSAPGETAFTWIPYSPDSFDKDLVKPWTAPFAVP